ncbi:hypothetical protein KC19_9G031000 [Ceratodon purpureus]|uniref:Galactose oxidase n=1 Tax=Ceratodon purpureus TaxID=3225 RepID=A0A8T0GR02_CERPU|nr:hypothetical protein KC19_9G031000 [Ceratodon purpureus]
MGEWRGGLVVMVLAMVVMYEGLVVDVEGAGAWRVVTKNAGITAMHAAVAPVTGNVVLLHQTNNGPSNMTFPDGRCKYYPDDRFLPKDCFVHSVIIDPNSGVVRPLFFQTDTQCSSGQFLRDGTLGQTGGDREGTQITRTLPFKCMYVNPTDKICDWVESSQKMAANTRWYATNQLLPDGRQIVVGGRGSPSYEFVPPYTVPPPKYDMPFLNVTSFDGPDKTKNGPNNIYPYVYLLPSSGYLYIFANRDSIIFDYKNNVVIRSFPQIPGNPRNYPSGGSSVMLPLTWQNGFKNKVEVVVCGGATVTWVANNSMPQPYCSVSCGRIEVTKAGSDWAMENMDIPRCMGDMVLLPDTNVLIINGAQRGWQGWDNAAEPAKNPILYNPTKPAGQRFTTLDAPPSGTPRMYHSTANLLTDGSVMVAGSNTNEFYKFTNNNKYWPPPGRFFPTELSVETFTPPYAGLGDRPVILSSNATTVKFNSVLQIVFWDNISQNPSTDTFLFTLNPPAFSTHSFSHGQRLVSLQALKITTTSGTQNGKPGNMRTVDLQIPVYTTVLPPAYYMLWVVKNGNPSVSCLWIQTR